MQENSDGKITVRFIFPENRLVFQGKVLIDLYGGVFHLLNRHIRVWIPNFFSRISHSKNLQAASVSARSLRFPLRLENFGF
jgi:hypothetical protein